MYLCTLPILVYCGCVRAILRVLLNQMQCVSSPTVLMFVFFLFSWGSVGEARRGAEAAGEGKGEREEGVCSSSKRARVK